MMRFPVAFLALFAVSFGPSATEAQNTCTTTSTNDIVSLACDSANADFFGDLCSALQATGIDGSIPALNGVYTVFAPLNSAFDAAGRRIGVTNAQKQATLQYHIVNEQVDTPACGDELDTLLFWNGERQTVEIGCTGGLVDSVVGDTNLPFPGSADPLIRGIGTTTTGTPPRIEACNGVIYPINNVLGFAPIQYDWNFQPCAFNEPNCIRPIFAKGGKGGVVVGQQNVGGLNFVSYTKKSKGYGYGYGNGWNWNQSFYANNANSYFGPYWNGYANGFGNGYGRPQYYGGYGSKHTKKGGYGYGGYGYGGGYGGYGGRNNFWWRKNRRNLGEDEDTMEDRTPSAYEPVEYYENEEAAATYEEPSSTAGDYYYNYRKNRNLRRGAVEQ